MNTLFPRSLVGRTIVVLLLAILLSNGLGLAAYLGERNRLEVAVRDQAIAERVAAAARLLEDSPAADRRQRVWSLRGPGMRMRWADQPLVADDLATDRARAVRRAFADELGADPGDGLRLSVGTGPMAGLGPPGPAPTAGERFGPDGEHRGRRPGSPTMTERMHSDTLRGALRLSDGSWLNFAAPLLSGSPIWTSSMLLLIAAASLAAAVIAAVAVWRASAPLSMFASAAERLGHDLDSQPLQETGPDEVVRAARAFNGMQARLQQMLRQRMHMLAALSHDLRTPITRLRLRAELLNDGGLQEKFLADLDQIERLTTASLEYVRDAFRDERPALLDLASLVQTVCDEAEDSGGRARYSGPEHATFVARPVALSRAIANLIDNAIKYGEEAVVSLLLDPAETAAAPRAGGATIVVEDRGPGLSVDERERVFEPFYRPDGSRSRDTGGVGLGLAIVKAVVNAHGGTISLANRAGGGLSATLWIPRLALPVEAVPPR